METKNGDISGSVQTTKAIPVELPVKVQIVKMFNDLFNKYKAEKTSVIHSYDEFYQNGLADGKLIALAEIKEAFSNLSA